MREIGDFSAFQDFIRTTCKDTGHKATDELIMECWDKYKKIYQKIPEVKKTGNFLEDMKSNWGLLSQLFSAIEDSILIHARQEGLTHDAAIRN